MRGIGGPCPRGPRVRAQALEGLSLASPPHLRRHMSEASQSRGGRAQLSDLHPLLLQVSHSSSHLHRSWGILREMENKCPVFL